MNNIVEVVSQILDNNSNQWKFELSNGDNLMIDESDYGKDIVYISDSGLSYKRVVGTMLEGFTIIQ